MNSISRRALAGIALPALLATVALSACGNDAAKDDELTPVKMGYVPWIGYGGWYISQDQGYFAENGVQVDLTVFNTDADKNNALAAGQIDVLNIATHGALQLIENDVPITIVLVEDISTTADAIIAGPGVNDISDLKGRSVAYEEITTSDILLNYALQANGLTLDDIERVPMAASDAGAAFLADRVEASVTYEPYLSEALAQDSEAKLLYTAGEEPGLISDVLVVRNEFLEEHPDAVQALIDSWGQGMAYYKSNTDAAQEIIANAVGADVETLATAFDGVVFYDLADNAEIFPGDYSQRVIPLVQDAAIAAGIMSDKVDFEKALNTSFIEASQK